MKRETVAEKGRRYLCEGRLVLRTVFLDTVLASCRGGGSVYTLGHEPGAGWHCDCCPARGHCSHLEALRLVTSTSSNQPIVPAAVGANGEGGHHEHA